MRTENLEMLFLEQMQDVRNVERQVFSALTRIGRGVSAKRLWQSLLRVVETTEQHRERLDRIFREIGPAHEDATICCPAVAERLRSAFPGAGPRASGAFAPEFARLTSREVEVLRMIAEGYANKQIAADLAISIKTVEKHRQHLMAKLDLHDTAGVTRYAISVGVVEAIA